MKKLCALALILLLSACASQRPYPTDDASLATLKPDEGVVVMGLSVRNSRSGVFGNSIPVFIRWMQYDRTSGLRVGQAMADSVERCKDGEGCTGVRYTRFKLPAGSYGMAYIFHMSLYQAADFERIQISAGVNDHEIRSAVLSDKARVRAGQPMFSVGAGEVVYVGNFIVDFSPRGSALDFGPPAGVNKSWSSVLTEAAARQSLVKAGLADRMVVRQGGIIGR